MFNSLRSRKRRPRARTPSRLWNIIKITLAIVIPAAIWVGVNRQALYEYTQARKQRDQVLREVEDLKIQIEQKKAEKARLQDREFGDEAVARSQKLVKPGEKIILLAPKKTEKALPESHPVHDAL